MSSMQVVEKPHSHIELQAVSVGQRMMWLMHHYQGQFGALNCPIIIAFEGELDYARLQQAWKTLVNTHEALHTCFVGRGQQLRRKVTAEIMTDFVIESLCTEQHSVDLSSQVFLDTLRDELRTPVTIEKQAFRTRLWKLSENLHVLCINQHHLVTDALSCSLVSHALGRGYEQKNIAMPEWQYSDFVDWETRHINGEKGQQHEQYWKHKLSGLKLPSLPKSRTMTSTDPEQDTITLYRATLKTNQALERIAKNCRASSFTVMLSIFYLHLYRLTGQYDLTISSLLNNRSEPQSQDLVGFVANMVLLRSRLHKKDTLKDIINEVREQVSGALAHQAFPYQLLPAGIVPADSARDIVFQMFAENTHQIASFETVNASAVNPPNGLSRRFDLDLAMMPSAEGMKIVMAASDLRFRSRFAKMFLQGFVELVEQISDENQEVIR